MTNIYAIHTARIRDYLVGSFHVNSVTITVKPDVLFRATLQTSASMLVF